MSYQILLSPRAERQLKELVDPFRDVVATHLLRLSISPVKLSRPSLPPKEVPGYQAYPFHFIWEGVRHRFVILFKYTVDEKALWVYAIGHVEYSN